MMYKLMVSHNAGCSYVEEATANDPSEFDERCNQLDEEMLRWAIEDEKGRPVHRGCVIHAGIVAFMENVNRAARIEEAQQRGQGEGEEQCQK